MVADLVVRYADALSVDRELTDRLRCDAARPLDTAALVDERRRVYVCAVMMSRPGMTEAEAAAEVEAARPELELVRDLAAAHDHAVRSAAAIRAVLDAVRDLPGVQSWLADHDRTG